MATPANSFHRVDRPDPASVTVSIDGPGTAPRGAVLGPSANGKPGLALGGDGSMTAHQALAVACQLANELGRSVVVMDPLGRWNPAWGRLGTA